MCNTASAKGGKLKAEWLAQPSSDFDYLALGEISVGDIFIYFPQPRDNDGHGGFKGLSRVYRKVGSRGPLGLSEEVVDRNGVLINFPSTVPVIILSK